MQSKGKRARSKDTRSAWAQRCADYLYDVIGPEVANDQKLPTTATIVVVVENTMVPPEDSSNIVPILRRMAQGIGPSGDQLETLKSFHSSCGTAAAKLLRSIETHGWPDNQHAMNSAVYPSVASVHSKAELFRLFQVQSDLMSRLRIEDKRGDSSITDIPATNGVLLHYYRFFHW